MATFLEYLKLFYFWLSFEFLFIFFFKERMPQLDVYNIFSQIFWGSFFFLSFYFLIILVVIPTVFSFLFSRSFLNSYNKDFYEISFSLTFVTENFIFDSFFDPTVKTLSDALISTVDSYNICESSLNEKNV